jgi:hypothetical protein
LLQAVRVNRLAHSQFQEPDSSKRFDANASVLAARQTIAVEMLEVEERTTVRLHGTDAFRAPNDVPSSRQLLEYAQVFGVGSALVERLVNGVEVPLNCRLFCGPIVAIYLTN